VPRSGAGSTFALRSGSLRGRSSRTARTPSWTSRTESPSTSATSRCVVELERVPLADGATLDDVGFGEDFELLAAVPEAGRFTAIGRVEEGEGVELLLNGEAYELAGWEHFQR
jgi:hypothetical protein